MRLPHVDTRYTWQAVYSGWMGDLQRLLMWFTLKVPVVTNVNFLLTISIQSQDIRLWELIKWSPKGKCLDQLSNSLNSFMKEMYGDQFGEFVCGYWGLKVNSVPVYCCCGGSLAASVACSWALPCCCIKVPWGAATATAVTPVWGCCWIW